MQHRAKIVERIVRIRIERKVEDVLGDYHFGFGRGKEIEMHLEC